MSLIDKLAKQSILQNQLQSQPQDNQQDRTHEYIDEIRELSLISKKNLETIDEAISAAINDIEEQSIQRQNPVSLKQPYSDYSSSKKFRSGYTIEDLAIETMLPIIKDWIDQNLERIITDVVKDEIKLAFQKTLDKSKK